jgi:protease I
MDPDLAGKRVAFLVADEGVEQSELMLPWQAIKRYGGRPELLAPSAGRVRAMKHLDKGDTFAVDHPIHAVTADRYIAMVLPGGVANADALRLDSDAVEFALAMFAARKPAAVICHGAWLLVEAGLVEGRTLTSWPSLQTDIRNAGGEWIDAEVHVCKDGPNVLVTSRKPDDLPAFNRVLLDVFSQAATARPTDAVGLPRRADDALVDEAGEESFPASDPPAFNSGVSAP